MLNRNKLKIAVWITLTSMAGLTACGKTGGAEEGIVILEQEEERGEYTLDAARIEDVVLTQKIKCIYRQIDDEELSFSVGGKEVSRVFVEEGDRVEKGDLLAQLISDDLDFEIQTVEYRIQRNELLMEQALANQAMDTQIVNHRYSYYEQTDKIQEEWARELAGIDDRYRYTLEDYQDRLEIDRLRLEALLEDKAKGSLYAGMSGKVSYVKKNLEGSSSKEEETVIKIIDDSLCLFISEQTEYRDCFSQDQSVQLKITSAKLIGTFEVFPYMPDTWTDKMYFAFADMPEDVEMEVGTSGEIVLVSEERKQVLTLPLTAIHDADGKTFVYVLGENQLREVKWITVGLRGDELIEVLDGLSEGDRVILK